MAQSVQQEIPVALHRAQLFFSMEFSGVLSVVRMADIAEEEEKMGIF